MKVLVVEDERNLNDAICHILGQAGYDTLAAYDGPGALDLAQKGGYDCMLLDVMLPGLSGFEVVRTLRDDGNDVPVIIVTAKSATADKIEGLDYGADDYMTKPIDTDELLARIRALTRRRGDRDVQVIVFEDLSLDQGTHDLSCGSHTVHLSQKEFEVMKLLMEANGVVSKQRLIESVWGTGDDVSENSAEAYISFLRKKLSHLDSRSQITTLRMLGYRLESSDGRVTMR